jgi:hypothetical protein
MNPDRRARAARWAVLLTLAAALLPGPAAARQPPKPDQADVYAITLKYARASDAVRLLGDLLGGPVPSYRVTTDEARNTILVAAPEPVIVRIREIINKIDVPGADNPLPQPKLSVFQLQFLEPDKTLEDALRLVFPQGKPGNFALDRQHRRVIVSADPVTTEAVEALLTRLDHPEVTRPEVNAQVRVVWLVNGLAREGAAPPPDDLKEVLPTLAKLGLDKPRLAAQALVNVTPNAEFHTKGVAQLDAPCQFAVTGRLKERRGSIGLDISIRATRDRGRVGPEDICNLQTEISAPIGHLVVLGVTPTESATSVFVVQILPGEARPPVQPK